MVSVQSRDLVLHPNGQMLEVSAQTADSIPRYLPRTSSRMPHDTRKTPSPCPPSQTSRPSSYRLSRELDELLRWEGLNRPHLSQESTSFRHEDIVEIVDYTDEDANGSNQSDPLDDNFGDSMNYSAISDILASAKRKLDLLEGNLKGARHSLLLAPALPSPVSTGSLRSTTSSTSKDSISTFSEEEISASMDKIWARTMGKTDPAPPRTPPNRSPRLEHFPVPSQYRVSNPMNDEDIPPVWLSSQHTRTSSSTSSTPQRYTNRNSSPSDHGRRCNIDADDLFNSENTNLSSMPFQYSSNQTYSPQTASSATTTIITPHENRPDAFDYENYLHRSSLNVFPPRRPSSSSARSSETARHSPSAETSSKPTSSLPSPSNPSTLTTNHRESYSTLATSTTTTTTTTVVNDSDSSTTDDWDSDSDVSDDQDLDDLLHADLECKWPVPPAFNKKPISSSTTNNTPTSTSRTPVSLTSYSATPISASAKQQPTRPQQRLKASISISAPLTLTPTTTAPTTIPANRTAKGAQEGDQAIMLALSEAMRDACLSLRDGGVEEQKVWRGRMAEARRVLRGEGC